MKIIAECCTGRCPTLELTENSTVVICDDYGNGVSLTIAQFEALIEQVKEFEDEQAIATPVGAVVMRYQQWRSLCDQYATAKS
ncbi:MAG TPA: hypothetical protein V6C65_04110 [Allocoleopsis sp.]